MEMATVKRTDRERNLTDERIEGYGKRRNEEKDKTRDQTGGTKRVNFVRLPTYR